ncbi:MAG: helicase-exonuclease AddAB subunit AddA [Clostridiales bacterium]|nr:helicase-exonuclease AddAB subunit AddA [Clostridiales bacterium]
MAAMKFTPEQQRVIDTRGKNILVSAAAGSGKTAVLVERIIQKITDREHPVDIDRLLIVTFTSAAAAQMRERIGLAIEERLYEDPENEHLQRQSALLHNAQITTIDSFCLFVVRNNFNDIGLDPAFRVGDEGEMRLLKQDTITELFEECFAQKGEAFSGLVEAFGKSGSEKPLAEQVLKLYEFAMSLPWPKEWLLERKSDYRMQSLEELEESCFMKGAWEEIQLLLEDALGILRKAIQICEEPSGPYMYGEMLDADVVMVEKLIRAAQSGMQSFYEEVCRISFPVLSRKKDESAEASKREQVKVLRKRVKDLLQEIKERYFYKRPEELLSDMHKTVEMTESLIDVTLLFLERFAQKKREKNIIDFADMEHFALDILVSRKDGGYEPTEAAAEYRRHFEEIMIDEYQDSNLVQETLLESISGEVQGRFNRFMVGDVKQSIYKFRLARPEIFLDKYERYAAGTETDCIRIDLKRNFRSRRQVLDSANYVFEHIMRKELGGVAYDAAAALYPGASYPEGGEAQKDGRQSGEKSPYQTELLLYDRASEKEAQDAKTKDAKEQEALTIAAQIRRMVGHFLVTDQESGELRPAVYRDMVILLRTNSGWDDVFVRVLTEAGIPAYASSKTGYFASPEIQTMLNFLKVIDNPRQDIPLFGVLKSLFGGFTEEELAYVKAVGNTVSECTLYEMFEHFVEESEKQEKKETGEEMDAVRPEAVVQKWKNFRSRLDQYRRMVTYTPVGRLIRTILADSGYLYAAAAMPGGEQRRANLEMLLAKAADFEKTSYYGLFHFLRYMEQMERYQIDYGEANLLDENADTVRIMSIHKSKGLEFPICFVAGLSKRFNMMDARETLLMDVELGLGAEYVDLQNRLRQNTFRKNVLSAKMKKDNLGEELRVLYVAMTRAKEKMILTAAVEDAEKLLEEKGGADGLFYSDLLTASNYLDLLLPCVRQTQDVIDVTVVSQADLMLSDLKREVRTSMSKQRLLFEEGRRGNYAEREMTDRLRERFAFVYPHEDLCGLYTKTTVSELKKVGHEDFYAGAADLYQKSQQEEIVPYLPRFMQQEKLVSGTDRGSAYHRVMELLRFSAWSGLARADWEAQAEEQMDRMQAAGRLSPLYRESVRSRTIAAFFESRLAGRMIQAEKEGRLYRERPFVLGISATRLNPAFPDQEMVLVQGIIDAYFEEDGKLVVVDYKTDRIQSRQELLKRYQVQLEYYAEALERITGKAVKETLLYSFALQQEVICSRRTVADGLWEKEGEGLTGKE